MSPGESEKSIEIAEIPFVQIEKILLALEEQMEQVLKRTPEGLTRKRKNKERRLKVGVEVDVQALAEFIPRLRSSIAEIRNILGSPLKGEGLAIQQIRDSLDGAMAMTELKKMTTADVEAIAGFLHVCLVQVKPEIKKINK